MAFGPAAGTAVNTTVGEAETRLKNISCNVPITKTTPKKIRSIRYDMKGFFNQVVERYCELAAGDVTIVEFTGESKHVDHHAKEPETYERELGGFLARALSRAKL